MKIGNVLVPLTKHIDISEDHLTKILDSKKFKDYLQNFNTQNVNVKSVNILSLFMFGKNNVGFVSLIVEVYSKINNVKLPGYVFLRGHAVSVLVVINKKYMLLVKQFRVPYGNFTLEFPAGMMDESGNFAATV